MESTPADPQGLRVPQTQRQGQGHYPRVVGQAPAADGTVLVTFSLPGLRRMTTRVPWRTWTEGQHLAVGAQPHDWLDAV